MTKDAYKQQAAEAALDYIESGMMVGVGTGSTVNFFISALGKIKGKIDGAVASSEASASLLKKQGIPVYDLNSVSNLPIYIDGADEVNPHKQLIKGGGGALTREKILATSAEQFICIVDKSKQVDVLGQFPLPVEVIPMARGLVARALVKMDGDPVYRQGFVTDNGNIILDVHGLKILDPKKIEMLINNITGVVCNGIFADRPADIVLLADEAGVKKY